MSQSKINWLAIKEPLRGTCKINTVDGIIEIDMHEPTDVETSHILKIWPNVPRPMRTERTPVETAEGGHRMDSKLVLDESPEALKKWREESDQMSEWQAMAYAESAIDPEFKPEGLTEKDRVAVLMEMPRQVRSKLANFAHSLGEKRLAERFEEAKK